MRGLIKYLAHIRISWAHARRAPAEIWGRMLFFAVILSVFSSLWRAVHDAGAAIDLSSERLVWYLAMTEWIVLSAPQIHYDVQEAIRRGDLVCHLVRPSSWVMTVCCEAMGQLLSRVVVLFATACVCATALTRTVPPWTSLSVVFMTGLAGAALIAAFHIAIGVAAFWVGDIVPLSWVWQKLLFLFGGLLMPIELYPTLVSRFASVSPFPSALSRPAAMLWQHDAGSVLMLVRDQMFWFAVIALILTAMARRAIAQLTVNGG